MMFGVLEAKSNGARGCPRHILIPHLIIIRHLPHLLIFTPHLEQKETILLKRGLGMRTI